MQNGSGSNIGLPKRMGQMTFSSSAVASLHCCALIVPGGACTAKCALSHCSGSPVVEPGSAHVPGTHRAEGGGVVVQPDAHVVVVVPRSHAFPPSLLPPSEPAPEAPLLSDELLPDELLPEKLPPPEEPPSPDAFGPPDDVSAALLAPDVPELRFPELPPEELPLPEELPPPEVPPSAPSPKLVCSGPSAHAVPNAQAASPRKSTQRVLTIGETSRLCCLSVKVTRGSRSELRKRPYLPVAAGVRCGRSFSSFLRRRGGAKFVSQPWDRTGTVLR
jgi:hypothetical protein